MGAKHCKQNEQINRKATMEARDVAAGINDEEYHRDIKIRGMNDQVQKRP